MNMRTKATHSTLNWRHNRKELSGDLTVRDSGSLNTTAIQQLFTN